MLLIFLLFYALPIYLVFVQYRWLPFTRFWKVAVCVPPLLAMVFLWFAIGRYTPMAQDAYVQAPVVQIAPQVSGVVREVLVRDNAAVKKGDPLFRIDPAPFQYRADQARAKMLETKEQSLGLLANVYAAGESVRRAEANLEAARTGIRTAQAGIEASQATVGKVVAQLELADAKVARNAKAAATGAVSKDDYEESLRTQAVQKASLVEAQQGEKIARTGYETSLAQVSSAEASLREASAGRAKASALIDPVAALRTAIRNMAAELEAKRANAGKEDKAPAAVLEAELVRFRAYLAEAEQLAPLLKGRLAGGLQAEEALKQASFDLEQTLVKAPEDGVVANLQLTPGSYVAAPPSLWSR